MTRTRHGMVEVVALLTLVGACGQEAAEIPFDSGPAPSTGPGTTDGLGAAVPPPSLDGSGPGVSTPPTTAAPTTLAPTADAWVEATGNLAGLPSECGNLSFVAAPPEGDTVVAGVALQGLWQNVAGSDEWTRLGQGPGSAVITNRGVGLVYDPEQPDKYYQSGNYNGGGVYKTTDGGATFQQLGDVVHSDFVSIDFSDPARATMLVGQHEQPVLHRSVDAGATWTDISAALPPAIGFAASPHVIDAQNHLLGTYSGEGAGVFRSADGGATWTVVHQGGVVGKVLAASDGNLYWLLEGGGGIITSSDGGQTWTDLVGPGVISGGSSALIELPDGRFATFSDTFVLVSPDKGRSWSTFGPGFPYVPTGMAYAPGRAAFYAWRFDCDPDTENPIPADAIVRLDLTSTG